MSAIEEDDRPLESETDEDPNLGEFQRLKKDIIKADRARSKWRTEAKESYAFVASDQWNEEDRAILAEQNRPEITFNRCAPILNAVCGLEVNNRQGVVYLPRTLDDTGVNEVYTNAGKWIRDECHAEDEESESFRDLAICGEGWTETRMDYDDDPKGMVVEERIDPLEMGVNKGACRRNYIDAQMIYRAREMDPDEVRALLALDPELNDAALDARWLSDSVVPEDGGQGNKKDYPEKTRDAVKSGRRGGRETVKVIQCQYWKREPVILVATEQDQEPQQMTEEEFAKFQARADAINAAADEALALDPLSPAQRMKYEHARSMKKVFYQCFIGNRILKLERLEMDTFQFKAMTGYRDREKKCFYGMIRDMKDPQRWANKWLSQTMNIMNTNAKGGLIAETDAFQNQRKAEKDWADPTKIVMVKPGALQKQKIKERTALPLPQGLESLMMFAISSIRDVTGVNLELLGQADREQAASLEAQRRQSAMTVLAAMFDSLRKYRKLQGRLMLQFIQLLPEGTLIRILEEGQYKYIPLVKEESVEKFDVIIDQSPSSPDQKQFVWAITAQILQMQILPPQAIIELLKYSPYPESVVLEIRKALGVDGQLPPDQLQQKLQQAEEALQFMEGKLKEEMEKSKELQDDKAIEILKLEVDEYQAETERLRAQWDARIKMAGAIATGERTSADIENQGRQTDIAEMSAVVNTGEQQLPDVGSGGQDVASLTNKVDQLAAMVGQLVQTLQPPSAEQVPPQPGNPEAPMGEM